MKILKISTETKILYSLLNLFAPILLIYIIAKIFVSSKGVLLLIVFASILLGFFQLINNILKYNKFVLLDDDNLYYCKGNPNKPIKIETISKNSIQKFEAGYSSFRAIVNNKKIKILNYAPSITSMLLTVGPLTVVFSSKINSLKMPFLVLLNEFIGKKDINREKVLKNWKNAGIIFGTLSWIIALMMAFFGTLVPLFAVFT